MPNCAKSWSLFIPLAASTLLCTAPLTAAASDELACASRVPTQVWSDSGSGGSHDVSIWRPAGGYSLGDLAVPGYGHTGELCGFLDKAAEQGNPALAPAIGFKWRYNDRKTGAKRNVSLWEPVCGPGYVAMGLVAAPSHLAELKCPADQTCTENRLFAEFERFRCVRADLTREIGGAPKFVWNDKKTGGAYDVSFWSRPGGAGEAAMKNLTFFWAHRSHATPNPTALTVARRELKPGTVVSPRPVDQFDEQHHYNIRLKGTNLYVAVEVAGVGQFYALTLDAADPRAQFHFRKVGAHHEVVNRSGGGVMFAGDKVGANPIEDTVHVHRTALVKGAKVPTRVKEWDIVRNGNNREFRVVGRAGGAAVVWAVKAKNGARLVNLAQAGAPAGESLFELLPVARVNTAEARSGVYDPDLGDDRALRLGIAVAAGLVSAATKGAGGGLVNIVGVFLAGNPNDAIAAALERLYNQVQIDIGNEIAAKSLTEAGNALLDATYELTVSYPNTLRDNISDPGRLLAIQNSAKDTARAFLDVRQRLILERQNNRIAAKPANAFLIEGGLQVFAAAAAMHAAALQEAAMIAAYDTVGGFEDELQTLDTEVERWIKDYQEMHAAQLNWRKDSVAVTAKLSPIFSFPLPKQRFDLTMAERPLLVVPSRTIGQYREENLKGSLNATTPVENALRDRYRGELDFAYERRYQPAEMAAGLRELKTATAALCAKIRVEGSPERQSYLDSALAGRASTQALVQVQPAAGVGLKAIGKSPAPAPAKPRRSRLKMVKQGKQITWVIEAVK